MKKQIEINESILKQLKEHNICPNCLGREQDIHSCYDIYWLFIADVLKERYNINIEF